MTNTIMPFRNFRDGSLSVLIASGLLIMMAGSCQFSKKTAGNLYRAAGEKEFDMVVVPGIQFENGKWGRIMKGRVYWAKHLYDRGIAKNIMFSGSAVYSPYYEAEIMALYAEAIGIPKKHLFTETRAEHSTENIYYSYKKAKKAGYKTIALASDPFQTKMLRRFIRRKVDDEVMLIPFVIDTMKLLEPTMKDPEIAYEKAHLSDFRSLKKREGFWKRLTGTLGWRIDKAAYK